MKTTRKPLDKRHEEFLDEISGYALSRNLILNRDSAYHDKMPEEQVARLQFDYSRGALAERLRCDTRIVNSEENRHVLLEAKTSCRTTGRNLHIVEAYQLGLHVAQNDQCMYATKKQFCGQTQEYGFYVNANFGLGQILEIRIPVLIYRNGTTVDRQSSECDDDYEFYEESFSRWFRNVPIKSCNTNIVANGSGDPYAVLNDDWIAGLPSWKVLIDRISPVIDDQNF